jgi:hypothetical protein
MTISSAQLMEAHLDHPVRISVDRLTTLERRIYDSTKATAHETLPLGRLQARIEHRPGRRAVHWRGVVENLKGPDYAEQVLAKTPPGDDTEVLVIEELPA